MEGLRGHTSGYAVPTYVIDAPGGGGKIPVMPNYLISYSRPQGRAAQLRGLHHDLRGARALPEARPGGVRVLPARAPGARPVRRPRAARGRADVDRAEGLRGGPPARQHRGAPAAGPVASGCRSASARSRARPGRRCRVLEAGEAAADARDPTTARARSRGRARASRPRRPTGSCSRLASDRRFATFAGDARCST